MMRLIFLGFAAVAALAFSSCSAPSSNALRTNDGVPIHNFPVSPGSSGPC